MFYVHRVSARPVLESCPMKAMVKPTILCGSLLSLLLIAGLIGCSNPTANPAKPQPEFREGIPLPQDTVSAALHITRSDQPYMVSHDWIIPEGQRVEIDAGTEIMFDSLWSVDVKGQFIAHGTVTRPIIFTTAHIRSAMGQWRGFKLHNSNPSQQSEFEHCIFSWGAFYDTDTTNVEAQTYRGMLAINNSSPTIMRCVVIRNQNNAVYMTGPNCAPHIRYNIFTKNDASAVRADTTVLLSNYLGEPNTPDIAYNCVGENSAISFLMGYDSTRYGVKLLINENLDSSDAFYNIDMAPMLEFQQGQSTDYFPTAWSPDGSDFALQSCSPAIDAGPADQDPDPDNTRADMGTIPYVQTGGELRGVVSGTLSAGTLYRISCNVRINPGTVLTIPAGTQIETTGLYTVEVHGRMVVQGVSGNRVHIAVGPTGGDLWGGIRFMNTDSLFAPSVIRGLDLVGYQALDVYKPGVVFENCRFDHGHDYGMAIVTKTPDFPDTVRVSDCTFTWCGLYGIKVDSSAATIRNTLITECRGRGVWLRYSGASVEITNCIVHTNTTIGLAMQDFSSPRVVNNVFAYNGYHGVEAINNCDPAIRNTIICRDARYGVSATQSSFPVLAYNDVFGHLIITGQDTSFVDYYSDGGLVHDATNISQDPRFVSGTDFHLASGSPCRNAGQNEDGTPTDMGAYGGPNGSNVGAVPIRQSVGGLALK